MERPKFQPIFTQKNEFCEKSSSKPVREFVPHQSLDLKELIARFERGQRLNVHSNFAAGSNFDNISKEEAMRRIKSESMDSDDFPPTDVYDVVDIQRLHEENEERKREFKKRIIERKQQQTPPTPPANGNVSPENVTL